MHFLMFLDLRVVFLFYYVGKCIHVCVCLGAGMECLFIPECVECCMYRLRCSVCCARERERG